MTTNYSIQQDEAMRRAFADDIEVRGTRVPSEHTTENTPHGHIVRAVFGCHDTARQYTYRCLDNVQIGDRIQAPGNSPATVVAFGPWTYSGPIKTARKLPDITCQDIPNYSKDTDMGKFAADYTPASRIENAEAELKAARKAAKRAKKLAHHKAAIAKENADRRKLALTALEQVAQFDANGACRIDAALALLERS